MKVLVLFLSLFSFLPSIGQESVIPNKDQDESFMSLSVYQDLKLLFVGDDLGNSAFTPDILVKLEVDAFVLKNSSFFFLLGAEYADLKSSSFQRFSIGFGYKTSFPFLKKFVFGTSIDHGLMLRGKSSFLGNAKVDESSFMGLSLNFETTYPVTDKTRLSLMIQAIDRKDLSIRFTTGNTIRYSIYFGAKFTL